METIDTLKTQALRTYEGTVTILDSIQALTKHNLITAEARDSFHSEFSTLTAYYAEKLDRLVEELKEVLRDLKESSQEDNEDNENP